MNENPIFCRMLFSRKLDLVNSNLTFILQTSILQLFTDWIIALWRNAGPIRTPTWDYLQGDTFSKTRFLLLPGGPIGFRWKWCSDSGSSMSKSYGSLEKNHEKSFHTRKTDTQFSTILSAAKRRTIIIDILFLSWLRKTKTRTVKRFWRF